MNLKNFAVDTANNIKEAGNKLGETIENAVQKAEVRKRNRQRQKRIDELKAQIHALEIEMEQE